MPQTLILGLMHEIKGIDMRNLVSTLKSLGLVLACLGFAAPAGAAPQALAVIAMDEGLALRCRDGQCSVDVKAFCLQPDRQSPALGTPYQAADYDGLQLVGTDAEGHTRALSSAKLLTITSARHHKMVRFALAEEILTAFGMTNVRLWIGARVTLLPKPVAGDDRPQTEADIALATGPLRILGQRLVDQDPSAGQAVRLMARMINLLPPDQQVSEETKASLWRRAGLAEAVAGLRPNVQRKISQGYANCQFIAGYKNLLSSQSATSMRDCLEAVHDGMLDSLNKRYWDGLSAGS